jgi:aminoglycoside phosphotransferase (APT) family kinase protein
MALCECFGVPEREPPYAFWDGDATRRLLGSPPPEAALRWVASAAAVTVERWTVMRGGTSSAMYALDVAGAARTTLVLRCHVRPDLKDEAPSTVVREAAALRTVASIDVPTPELVAQDATGAEAGVPAVLMTRLPGRVVWDPSARARWLARLAGVLPALHGAGTDDVDLGRYANYAQTSYEPPAWATSRPVWERAVEIFHGPVLDPERCFVHRDFHPGNVLWHRGRVSGVVDWASACLGPPSVDIGHCRANLLGYDPELAALYTRLAEGATGRPFHPWADIAALIGMLDGLRLHPPRPAGRQAIERALAQAVAGCS